MELARDFIKLESGRNRVEFLFLLFGVGQFLDEIGTFFAAFVELTAR
jgi:hypothetical protein